MNKRIALKTKQLAALWTDHRDPRDQVAVVAFLLEAHEAPVALTSRRGTIPHARPTCYIGGVQVALNLVKQLNREQVVVGAGQVRRRHQCEPTDVALARQLLNFRVAPGAGEPATAEVATGTQKRTSRRIFSVPLWKPHPNLKGAQNI
jgi:hypothetical protein